jgi:hypothetical protein
MGNRIASSVSHCDHAITNETPSASAFLKMHVGELVKSKPRDSVSAGDEGTYLNVLTSTHNPEQADNRQQLTLTDAATQKNDSADEARQQHRHQKRPVNPRWLVEHP